MELLRSMAMFVAVAKTKSFTRASRELSVPISSLSRRITEFEAQIGIRLFNRNTRKLVLTEAGKTYFDRASAIVDAATAAHEELKDLAERPRGRLRISMPADFGEVFLSPLFAEYARRYPEVTFEFDLSPRLVDLVAENFDVAIRIGAQADSNLSTRKLATARMGLFASDDYLQRSGAPRHPSELAKHDCLRMMRANQLKTSWVLTRGKERVAVTVQGRAAANGPRLLRRLAIFGLGIAVLDELIVVDDLEEGTLRRVLPEWSMAAEPIFVVTPSKLLPAKTKLFVACLVEHLELSRKRLDKS